MRLTARRAWKSLLLTVAMVIAFLVVTTGTASARGPVTLYCQSPASVMKLNFLNWTNMAPCTSYYADAVKPYQGWGFTYYAYGARYKVECRSPGYGCPQVGVPADGVRIVGVYHLY